MDIGLLEKSHHMKPLLVKLYDTHHVCHLDGKTGSIARSELSNVVSELLNVSVEDRERELVADILLALIQQAEIELRQALAEKLSTMKNVPSRLILNLAYDEIEVAESVLRLSPVLESLDLMYILQCKSPEYWRAIAARESLAEIIIDELSVLKDDRTHVILAGNENLVLSESALNNLFESASRSKSVAMPFIARSDIPKELVKKLYRAVGDELKMVIQEKYGVVGEVISSEIDAIVTDKFGKAGVHPYLPSEELIASEYAKSQIRTERQSQIKSLSLQEMRYVLKLKKYKMFVAKFAVFMGITGVDAVEILSQQYGHGLAVLCRAHSVDRNEFIKFFLLTDPIRSREYAMKGVTLNRALAYYDRLSADLARDLYVKNFLSNN